MGQLGRCEPGQPHVGQRDKAISVRDVVQRNPAEDRGRGSPRKLEEACLVGCWSSMLERKAGIHEVPGFPAMELGLSLSPGDLPMALEQNSPLRKESLMSH